VAGKVGRPDLVVAEDDAALAKVLKMRLEIEGFDVRLAADGREALALLRAKAPDLLVCDLMMPEVDGYEVTRQVKSDPKLKRVPILILTALKEAKEREKLIKLGADGFAAKPFDSKELTATIRSLLG
jgi:DNA-binding response OmpR family regulator